MNESIVGTLELSRKIVHAFVDELTPEQMAFQIAPEMNSVGWILGHLAISEYRALRRLGLPNLPELPAGFEDRFAPAGPGTKPRTDFGNAKENLALFDRVRDQFLAAVRTLTPEVMAEEIQPPHPRFKTKGEMCAFMPLHVMLHMGQVSLIRRALGLPALF